MLNGSSILITGGTGSLGHAFVPMTLKKYAPRRLIIYSRDEMKQWEMAKHYGDDPPRSLLPRGCARQGSAPPRPGLRWTPKIGQIGK